MRLKETADTCYHARCGTFRLYQDDQIICIACEPMTALFELLIEVIQKDIGKDTGDILYAPLEAHYDIRTVQELLGHHDVSTTTIYTHVLNRPPA